MQRTTTATEGQKDHAKSSPTRTQGPKASSKIARPPLYTDLPPLALSGANPTQPSPSSSIHSARSSSDSSTSDTDELHHHLRRSPLTLGAAEASSNESASTSPPPIAHDAASHTTASKPTESSITDIVDNLDITKAILNADSLGLKLQPFEVTEDAFKGKIKQIKIDTKKLDINKIEQGLIAFNNLLSEKITDEKKLSLEKNKTKLKLFCLCINQNASQIKIKSIESMLKKLLDFINNNFENPANRFFRQAPKSQISIIGMQNSSFPADLFEYQLSDFFESLIQLSDLLKEVTYLEKNTDHTKDSESIEKILKKLSNIPFRNNVDDLLENSCPEFVCFVIKHLHHIPPAMLINAKESRRELICIIKIFIVQVLKSQLRNPIISKTINGSGFEFLDGFFSHQKTSDAKEHENTLQSFIKTSIANELKSFATIIKQLNTKKSKSIAQLQDKKKKPPLKPDSSSKEKKSGYVAPKKESQLGTIDKEIAIYEEKIKRYNENKAKFYNEIIAAIKEDDVLIELYTFPFKEYIKDENKPNKEYFLKEFPTLINLYHTFVQDNLHNTLNQFKIGFQTTSDWIVFVSRASDLVNFLREIIDEKTRIKLQTLPCWNELETFRHTITHIPDNLNQMKAIMLDYRTSVKKVEPELVRFFVNAIDNLILIHSKATPLSTAPVNVASTAVIMASTAEAASTPPMTLQEDHKTLAKTKKESTKSSGIIARLEIARAMICILKQIKSLPHNDNTDEIQRIDVLIQAIGEALGCLSALDAIKMLYHDEHKLHKNPFPTEEDKDNFKRFIKNIQELRNYRNFRTHSGRKLQVLELGEYFAILKRENFSKQLDLCLKIFLTPNANTAMNNNAKYTTEKGATAHPKTPQTKSGCAAATPPLKESNSTTLLGYLQRLFAATDTEGIDLNKESDILSNNCTIS